MENNTILQVLNEKQRIFLEENIGKLKELELYTKLRELGSDLKEEDFFKCLKEIAMEKETRVFSQIASEEELASINGGLCGFNGKACDNLADERCTGLYNRNIYEGGFPNCAATVEDGSWCDSSDACYLDQVVYKGMKSWTCLKAWE